MYKMNTQYPASIKEKYLSLYKKFSIKVKEVYIQDVVAAFSSKLTDIFPEIGKYVTDFFVALIYNRLTANILKKMDIHTLSKITTLNNILVISDLNIGDAVNLQSVVLSIKTVFPQSKIDYVVNKNAYDIIFLNPNINRCFGILSNDTKSSAKVVSLLVNSGKYDLVINLCPVLKKNSIAEKNRTIPYLSFESLSAHIIHNELYSNRINHISYQAYYYFSRLFKEMVKIPNHSAVDAFVPLLRIPNKVLGEAKMFLTENGLFNNKGLVLFNPDATSKYTQVPFNIQLDMLERLIKSSFVKTILLTSGHSSAGIENKLIEPVADKDKIVIIPKNMPLDVYAALIDFCDIFITADTGTMHIAAAKKFDERGNELRNKTAIFSIFGATSARMYGYDSFSNNFLDSAQNAPAKLYISKALCKNITCVNKRAKRCALTRCFNGISGMQIVKDIEDYLEDK